MEKESLPPQTITGYIKKGHGKGNKTGLKTANLDVELAKNLLKGLYTCEVILGKKKYPGLLYYGYNSLSKKDCLEVHIIDFTGDIYGKITTVKINKYLRAEKKFSTIKALKKQLKEDLAELPHY